MHLDVLVELMNGRTSPTFWTRHAVLNAEHKQRIGEA